MKKRIKLQGTLVFLAVILSVILKKYVIPDWGREGMEEFFDIAGLILVFSGFALRILARGYKEEKTHGGNKLVVNGPYRLMRNPMYFGTLLIGVGVISVLFKWWVLLLFLLAYIVIYLPQVNKEEKMLLDRFGKDYKDYCKSASKYFPHPLRLLNTKAYLSELKFFWIKKELPSLFTTILIIFSLEIYQDVLMFGLGQIYDEALEFILIIAFFTLLTWAVIYKNKHK